MQCAEHPDTETGLSCGKCEKPICPRCLYHTPVGARCRECADIRRLPIYSISTKYLLRGGGAALASGLVLGGFWGIFLPSGGFFFFLLIVGFGMGYVMGESVSMAANRKAGPPLQALAAGGIVLAYVVRSAILALRYEHLGIMDIVTNDMIGFIAVGIAAFVAIGRLR